MSNNDLPEDVLARLQALERRFAQVEEKIDRAAGAYVMARRRLRRAWVLKPPLWKFEQYAPRPVAVDPSYARERLPDQPPRIAIVTPTYNQAHYLRATIESVFAQEYPNLVYFVQDGGSTDGTADVLKAYGDRLLWRSERDSGQAQAINRAFNGVACEIMAYLNSDDMLLPGTLAYIAKAFLANPDVDVVYGHRIFVDREGCEIGRAVLPGHDPQTLKWADYIPQETMFWRRRTWDAVGPIDESFRFALDWDFILRAQAAGFKFRRLPRFLACFRVHDEQKSAVMLGVGEEEMQRIRHEHLGYAPNRPQIRRAILPYLLRQFVLHCLYKFKLLRY
jgi:glycosyltransferase involved in cell wall biosynthesis